MKRLSLLIALPALLALGSCRKGERAPGEKGSASSGGGRDVLVYSSTDKEFSELVFDAYRKKTGVRVLPVYDTEETKTAGLTARLVAEAAHPKADVFWSSDTSRAVALLDRGVIAPYDSPSAAGIPAKYKDPQHRWTGFGARIRVILYNTDRVKPDRVPKSVTDFTRPEWKGRFAMPNPHFGTMSFHAAALFLLWGDEKATAFFRKLKENDVVLAAGNADVTARVGDGKVDAGIVDEDDAIVALREKKPVALVIPDQEEGGIGTPVMPNTAMLIAGAPNPEEARRFLDFLVSAEAERILAESAASQIPLHPGVPGPAALPPLDKIRVLDVDYGAVARKLGAMDESLKKVLGI